MLLANINHRLLQRLNMKYLAQNRSVYQCKYLLPTLCLLYHICLQGAGTPKGSLANRDYSLFWASRSRQPQDLAAHSLSLRFGRASSVKPEKCLVMLTCWFNFAKCVDHLFEPYADQVGGEEQERKCDDFESIAPTNNWQDDQVQSQGNRVTRPPSSFHKQLHFGDLIMAEFKFQGGFLHYYGYDSQIHTFTWSTLARRTRTRMRAWPVRRVYKAMATMLHSPR